MKQSHILGLQVTKDDLQDGVPGDPGKCPVALALQRQFTADEGDVRVGFLKAYVAGREFALSEYAYDFIMDFDDGRVLAPDTLSLYREVDDEEA